MKPNEYRIMSECVDRGIKYGLGRAFKYDENPSHEDLVMKISDSIMNEICDYWNFADVQTDSNV